MIRKYQTDDTDMLVAVWQSASAVAHSFLKESFLAQEAINLRELYLPHAETWVLQQDGKPIGFIALNGDEIGGLFLDPAFHGKGHGRSMVDHAVALKGPLCVEVFAQNTIGRRFYERYGFVETGRYHFQPAGEVMLRMAMPTL